MREREQRLPKWAQRELDRLRKQLAEAKVREHKRLLETKSSIEFGYGPGGGPIGYVPDGERVVFNFEGKYKYIDVQEYEGGLRIHGSRPVLVRGSAANCLDVFLDPDY